MMVDFNQTLNQLSNKNSNDFNLPNSPLLFTKKKE